MSARYLLDTNIVSDLVRHPQGPAALKIAEVGEDAVATSIIVAAELRYGAAKKGSSRLASQLATARSAPKRSQAAPVVGWVMFAKAPRHFVSSTFQDFGEERRLVQERVFPALEAHCTRVGFGFRAIDLCWGVNDDAQP